MPEYGEVVYTVHYDPGVTRVTIDRADPHAMVSDQVLQQVCEHTEYIKGILHPGHMRLEPSPHKRYCQPPCAYPSHPFCWTDWLLHIDLPGHHLVYRIGKYRPEQNAWEASWPD